MLRLHLILCLQFLSLNVDRELMAGLLFIWWVVELGAYVCAKRICWADWDVPPHNLRCHLGFIRALLRRDEGKEARDE